METHILSSLQNALSKFGLNPAEWSLKPAGDNRFLIHHLGNDMQLLGLAVQKGLSFDWKSVRLISL